MRLIGYNSAGIACQFCQTDGIRAEQYTPGISLSVIESKCAPLLFNISTGLNAVCRFDFSLWCEKSARSFLQEARAILHAANLFFVVVVSPGIYEPQLIIGQQIVWVLKS